MPLQVWKFIDDFLAGERLSLGASQKFFSQIKPLARIHAQESEQFFKMIAENAEKVGMIVNDQKTQLLCVSTSIEFDVSSYIKMSDGTS